MRKKITTLAVLASIAAAQAATAADIGPSTTVGGVSFIDFGYIKQQSNGVDVAPSGIGFDVKRAYLSVDHTFNDMFSANLTADAQYSSTVGATEFFIKKAYVQAKLSDALVLRAGSASLPWIDWVENNLDLHRYVEKGMLDRLGFGTTADWGLHAAGKFADGMAGYGIAIVNGAGYKNPARTKDVDIEARVNVAPVEWLNLAAGFYTGHLGQVTETVSVSNLPTQTATRWDLAAGVKYQGVRVNAEYFQAKNYKAYGGAGALTTTNVLVGATPTTTLLKDEAKGFSTWVAYDFTTEYNVFARYDNVKPSDTIHSPLKDQLFIVGLGYNPIKQLNLTLAYKYEKVDNGILSVSSADGGGSYTIGGTSNGITGGKFNELGLYAQVKF